MKNEQTASQFESEFAKNCSAVLNELLGNSPESNGSNTEADNIYLAAGEQLFVQSDPGRSVFIVVEGELSICLNNNANSPISPNPQHQDKTPSETEINRLSPGSIVGEMAVMSDGLRSASVYAITDVVLRRIDGEKFRDFIASNSRFRTLINDVVYERWRPLALNEVLVKRFGDSDPALLESIQAHAKWHHLSAGETLFRQEDNSSEMYIVVCGRLRLDVEVAKVYRSESKMHDASQRNIGFVSAGETIGEFGLITEEPRTATITAMRESNLVSLTAEVFNELMHKHPSFSRTVLKIIIERQLRADPSSHHSTSYTHSLALVGGNIGLSIGDFSRELTESWPRDENLLVLDSERFDLLYGQPGASQASQMDPMHPSVTTWMSKLESQYKTLIYIADSTPTPWTKRCLNQVDEVVIVVDPAIGDGPEDTREKMEIIPAHVPRRLALWHSADTKQPEGTARWLKSLEVISHHHIRNNDSDHMQRLARHLAGRAICLVYSGGGARGAAHAGVYRAMTELDIPIDMIGGTSIGALATGTVALGISYEMMIKALGERANAKALMDYTFPVTALLKSDKINDTCRALFADTCIEDLWIPSFYVSTNLTRSEQQIHQHGLLWRAVRASMSIPGVFTPVMENGDMLVDGAVMNNFPIDVMKQITGSPNIIAVNLNPKRKHERPWDLDASVSGWRVISSGLNPFGRRIAAPSIAKTMMRTITAASDKAARESEIHATLVINPEIKTAGILDFSDYKGAADSGRTAAMETLRNWRIENASLLER